MMRNILLNYLILLICILGFRSGAMIAFILPFVQISLTCVNYYHSKKWQTILMLQIHLLISTVIGLFLEGYLYLKYISNDTESIIVFNALMQIGAVLVFSLGIITTLVKYVSTRSRKQKDLQ